MSSKAHGSIGANLEPFTILLPNHAASFDPGELLALSKLMKAEPDSPRDGADPEENLWVPAGYTYFGQFVDHDLTFDSTSSLNAHDRLRRDGSLPTNARSPRLDLDSLYGDGPDAQPFMYADDGASLLVADDGQDLLRSSNGRAIIGDKRNDENSIVCQIHLGMVRYHNRVVAELKAARPAHYADNATELFADARQEVIWTYQRLVVEDFLPRIVDHDVLAPFQGKTFDERLNEYALYTHAKRANLPREFVGAAYRYGHSGVRFGYRLNLTTRLPIFRGSDSQASGAPTADTSLMGFRRLPASHVIDTWGRFFPDSGPGADIGRTDREAVRDTVERPEPALLQYAYKLDTSLVDPLSVLPRDVPEPTAAKEAADKLDHAHPPRQLPRHPCMRDEDPKHPFVSLALLNLLRGSTYGLPSGQSVVRVLHAKGKKVDVVPPERMVVRVVAPAPGDGNGAGDGVGDGNGTAAACPVPAAAPANAPEAPESPTIFQWQQLPGTLGERTPLWFYILAEAQEPIVKAIPLDAQGRFSDEELMKGIGALSQLRGVGGRIVTEVFYGLLDEDIHSILRDHHGKVFQPRFVREGRRLCVRSLLDWGAAPPAGPAA